MIFIYPFDGRNLAPWFHAKRYGKKEVDTGDRSLDIFLGGCDQMQLDQCVFSLLCFVASKWCRLSEPLDL